MLNFSRHRQFTISHEDWTNEDDDDLKMLMQFPKFSALVKRINNRINKRTEELVNGSDTRDRIDELADLLQELKNHADTR